MKRFITAVLLLFWPPLVLATNGDFSNWLIQLRQEALQKGITAATVDQALSGVQPVERVVQLDRKQAEDVLPVSTYLAQMVTPEKIARGQRLLREHRTLLNGIAKRYGVHVHYLVALWGIESDYGRRQGSMPVIQSLVTLAYDSRRADYFREELINALRILDQAHIPLERMTGSWAGAMGQVQFMPSSFLNFAVDYDGDGRKDIWDSPADALASAARYLAENGWQQGVGWGEKVVLPRRFDQRLAGREHKKSLRDWRRLGVRGIDGPNSLQASLLLPDGIPGPAYLVYDNYLVLLKWNRSTSFAMAVGHLAQQIYALDRKG